MVDAILIGGLFLWMIASIIGTIFSFIFMMGNDNLTQRWQAFFVCVAFVLMGIWLVVLNNNPAEWARLWISK